MTIINSGDHISLPTDTLLGQMIASANAKLVDAVREFQQAQLLMNSIRGADTPLNANLGTDSASLFPSDKCDDIVSAVQDVTDALAAVPKRYVLFQG